jgi:PIN domain nuclease of toxin-antitoxin system
MNILIDTHALIWFITDHQELPHSAKRRIEDLENNCFVSVASLWEMGIKYALGKLSLKADLERIFELIEQSGVAVLPITSAHILTSTTLEFHHRDPFDRLIIAQAKREGLTLISKDSIFKDYEINVLWE